MTESRQSQGYLEMKGLSPRLSNWYLDLKMISPASPKGIRSRNSKVLPVLRAREAEMADTWKNGTLTTFAQLLTSISIRGYDGKWCFHCDQMTRNDQM